MTIGEVSRYIEAQNKKMTMQNQEKASHNYILANLIVRGVGITLGSKEHYPTIDEVYPSLFDNIKEEQRAKVEQQKMELSALRFRQFAQSYNNRKHKEVQNKNE
jgi:hypothetical protein